MRTYVDGLFDHLCGKNLAEVGGKRKSKVTVAAVELQAVPPWSLLMQICIAHFLNGVGNACGGANMHACSKTCTGIATKTA